MANDGKWQTVQYLLERVKVIKCFHPRMLTLPEACVNTNLIELLYHSLFFGINKNRF